MDQASDKSSLLGKKSKRGFMSLPTQRYYNVLHKLQDEDNNMKDESYRFVLMSCLTSTILVSEIIVGVLSGSLTLLADAFHMFSDLLSWYVAYYAHKMGHMADKQLVGNGDARSVSHVSHSRCSLHHKHDRMNHDLEHVAVFMRYEIIGAMLNSTIILTAAVIMSISAIERIAFAHIEIQNALVAMFVGCGSLTFNVAGLFIFGYEEEELGEDEEDEVESNYGSAPSVAGSEAGKRKDMNIQAVFIHIAADVLGSSAVIASMATLYFTTGWWNLYIDPGCTLFICCLLSAGAWPLLTASVDILLDKAPGSISTAKLERELMAVPGVVNVHELRVWQVIPGHKVGCVHVTVHPEYSMSGHTQGVCKDGCQVNHTKMSILDQAKSIMHKNGVHSSVVQTEFPSETDDVEWKLSTNPCMDTVCPPNNVTCQEHVRSVLRSQKCKSKRCQLVSLKGGKGFIGAKAGDIAVEMTGKGAEEHTH